MMGAKGRLGGKISVVLLALVASKTLGQFNVYPVKRQSEDEEAKLFPFRFPTLF
jgi:hypothetical protein